MNTTTTVNAFEQRFPKETQQAKDIELEMTLKLREASSEQERSSLRKYYNKLIYEVTSEAMHAEMEESNKLRKMDSVGVVTKALREAIFFHQKSGDLARTDAHYPCLVCGKVAAPGEIFAISTDGSSDATHLNCLLDGMEIDVRQTTFVCIE